MEKIIYKADAEITERIIQDGYEELFIKSLCCKVINEMPLSDVKKIFSVSVKANDNLDGYRYGNLTYSAEIKI